MVSNFVVHEMDTGAEREKMLSEIVRVLRPGGRVALVDFIFTGQCVDVLRGCGLADARRDPIGPPPLLTFGLLRTYRVSATRPA